MKGLPEELEEKFGNGPRSDDQTHCGFWTVLTPNEREALVNFIYDYTARQNKLTAERADREAHLAVLLRNRAEEKGVYTSDL